MWRFYLRYVHDCSESQLSCHINAKIKQIKGTFLSNVNLIEIPLRGAQAWERVGTLPGMSLLQSCSMALQVSNKNCIGRGWSTCAGVGLTEDIRGPGAPFTNGFLPAIQIRWKLRLAVIALRAIRSRQIFAHATTAQLSCHVQNSVAINLLDSRWECNEISIEFEMRWKSR